jgi:hypothetical protein
VPLARAQIDIGLRISDCGLETATPSSIIVDEGVASFNQLLL